MAKKQAKPEKVVPHRHDSHEHELPEHSHPQGNYADFVHTHEPVAHSHDQRHEHEPVVHEHPSHRALAVGAVRALLTVLELGTVNTVQVKAIHAVRVIIGDEYGLGCAHENTALEAGDVNVCLDCREVLPAPDPHPNQE